MAWTGKLIGGVLGSLLGPIGTVVGVGIGHQFDKGATKLKQTAQTFQVAFFGCLAKMARADGTISKEEIEAVEQIMARFNYTGAIREQAIEIFRRAKDDQHTAADYINQLAGVIQFNPQIALTFITALHAVAAADGEIHPNEREILLQAERAFRLRPGTIDAMLGGGVRSNAPNALENAYKVLDVSPEATDAEIKKIYRHKCMEFHPDKLASKGLPEEFMVYAHDQLTQINDAYDIIKKERGL
ncbi:co-chaperone DjlA [Pontiellaceae bacterium B12219]|nr:co-chaperone DjlA [Pontiellaceae bacterium B12219]